MGVETEQIPLIDLFELVCEVLNRLKSGAFLCEKMLKNGEKSLRFLVEKAQKFGNFFFGLVVEF